MSNTGFIANQNKKGCVSTKFIGMLKEIAAQDRARLDNGARPRVTKTRKCLKCDVEFVSRQENRTCVTCRYENGFKVGIEG